MKAKFYLLKRHLFINLLKLKKMKHLLIILCLIVGIKQITKAQPVCANFVGPWANVTTENNLWGTFNAHHFDCLEDIIIDLSCSIGISSYHLTIGEYNPAIADFSKHYHSAYGVNAPPTINISSYFPYNEPTCGKFYVIRFVDVTTGWDEAPWLYFTIDCSSIPFEETYACKENLRKDSTSIDIAFDQLHLKDGTRVVAGYTQLGSQSSLFIEKADPTGMVSDKKQYPVSGSSVSNVQIVYDKPQDEFILFYDTNESGNRNVYIINVNSTTLASIDRHEAIVPDVGSEFAVKIEPDYDGNFVLLVNQTIGTVKNAYTVFMQRSGAAFLFSHGQIFINSSTNISAYDIIETSRRVAGGHCSSTEPYNSYLICGTVDKEAFLIGANCNGVVFSVANTFNIDGNANTTDVAKRIEYYNNNFYVAGETKAYYTFGDGTTGPTSISGKIWLGEFDVNEIVAPQLYFSATDIWINLYENSSNKTETITDLQFSDDYLYLSGQTNIEEGLFVPFGTKSKAKSYIFKTDLTGNPIWSRNYYEDVNSYSNIYDIELVCGSIQGVGNCNDIITIPNNNGSIPPTVEQYTNRFIYKNKTNLDGRVSKQNCSNEITFTPIAANPPVNEPDSYTYGNSLSYIRVQQGYNDLKCVQECCSNYGTPAPCCSEDLQDFCNKSEFNTNITTIDCFVYIDFPEADTCQYVTVDWADGNIDGPKQMPDVFGHTYLSSGLYPLCIEAVEYNAYGDTCYYKKYYIEQEVLCPIDTNACPVPDNFALRPGDAFVTCYSGGIGTDPVAGIKNVDIIEPNSLPYGVNLAGTTVGTMAGAMFSKNDIGGEVFGTCIDNEGNIYVTASTLYGYNGTVFSGPNGFASIIKLDGSTMTIDPSFGSNLNLSGISPGKFVNNIGNGVVVNNGSWPNLSSEQIYSGLGNICYDAHNGQLLVSNFEDGKIHRINKQGFYIDAFDPLLPLLDDLTPGFAPLGERVWGLQAFYNPVTGNTEVYYGVWSEDRRVGSSTTGLNATSGPNTLRMVEINSAGSFDILSDQHLLTIPDIVGTSFSSPVSDIAISKDGLQMILATRSMPADINKYLGSNTIGAHVSSFYYMDRTNLLTAWNTSNLTTFNNGTNQAKNSAGGVDFGPKQAVENFDTGSICDQTIWTTGDNLLNDGTHGWNYGLCGFSVNEIFGASPINDNFKYVVDLDNFTGTGYKSLIGDVEVFKCDCTPCDTTCTDLMVNQTFLQDTCCYEVGIDNNYCDPIISLETEVLTPGWQFNTSSIYVNANYAGIPNPYKFKVSYNNGFYPLGSTPNIMDFCLTEDKTITNPATTQQVKYTWYELSGTDTLAICDTIANTNCDDYFDECLKVDSVLVECDTLDNVYKVDFQITNYKPNPSTHMQIRDVGVGYQFSTTSTGPFANNYYHSLIVPGSGGTANVTVYIKTPGTIFIPTTECFNVSLIRNVPDSTAYCCHVPKALCVTFEPCCIETKIISLECDTTTSPINQYVLNFSITNRSSLPLQGLSVDVKNTDPSITLLPSGGLFDFTSTPILQNGTKNLTEYVVPSPITDSHLVLGYIAHYSPTFSIDSCCFEVKCDSIPIPICCDETVQSNVLMSNYRTAVTCGVTGDFLPASSRYTFGMIDHSSVLPTTGRNDFTGSALVSDFHHPSWHINSIGNVFGIAIDYEGNAYAAASANYGSGYLGSDALIQYGNIGGGANNLGAAGTIYKMDNITGQASVFCQLPQNAFNFAHQTCEGPSPDINRTTGPALGNIVYDEINNQMFAANWEDGRIYRIDMNGSILDSYDPGILDNNNVGMPSIDNDLIPYGLDIDDDASRLFFGTLYNGTTLYSIDLNSNGSFAGTINNSSGNSSLTIDNYVNNEVLHFSFASLIPASDFQSISDLEFLPNGNFMVGLRRGCNNNFATSYNHHATSYMLSENAGIYNTLISQIPISYDSNLPFTSSFDGDDQYGGVAYMEFDSYPFELVVSSSDILSEPGPHGIVVFEQSFTGAPITNLAAIAYAPITADTDMKGIGGDVQVFNPCYIFEKPLIQEFCPPIDVISLNAGWNLLSLDVTPEQPSVDSIFNTFTPSNLEIAVGFDNGAIVYDPLLPPFLNSLNTLQDGYGYWVKLAEDDVLEITGTCLLDTFKRNFDAGWNLIAYPPAATSDPGNYFENEIESNNLINVSGYDMGTFVYNPSLPPFLNSLDSLRNGYGYWIKLNNAVTNKNGPSFESNVFSFITGTTNLTEGSIINIETAVEQVGEIKVLQDGYLSITPIYGDDLITLNKQEGLTIGETLYFNYNGQISETNSIFKGDMSLEKVNLDFDQTTSFTIHPNPNNGSFKIDLGQPLINGFVEVIDATGKVQYRSQIKNASAYLNLGNVKPGIYMIKVADEKSAEIQKVIIH